MLLIVIILFYFDQVLIWGTIRTEVIYLIIIIKKAVATSARLPLQYPIVDKRGLLDYVEYYADLRTKHNDVKYD